MYPQPRTLRNGLFWLIGLLVCLPAAVYASNQDARSIRQGTIPAGSAAIDVAHFAPFSSTIPQTSVTVNISGETTLTDLRFGDVISNVVVPAGQYSITVVPTGAPSGTIAISDSLTFNEDVHYTLAAIGDNDNQPLELFSLVRDIITPTTGAAVRVTHLAPLAADLNDTKVDLCTAANDVIIPGLAYKESATFNRPAGDYDLKIALAGSNCEDVALDLPSIRLSDGAVVDLYVIGDNTNQPLDIASTTGFTLTPGGGGKARITIVKDAQPNRIRNFRFAGDLGHFRLDDAKPNDHDQIPKRKTFRVNPGTYNMGEDLPYRWLQSAITCEGGSTTPNLDGAFVSITANAGDEITCTFVNQRDVTLRVRTYNDLNDNSQLDRGDSFLPGWTITLYDAQHNVVSSGVTNIFGKANFRFLAPGDYTVCQTPQNGWTNTQPGQLNSDFDNQPCYSFTANPAELIYLRFGNLNGVSAASAASRSGAYTGGIIRQIDPYQDADDAGYDAPASDPDLDLLQPDDPGQGQQPAGTIFLPLVTDSGQ